MLDSVTSCAAVFRPALPIYACYQPLPEALQPFSDVLLGILPLDDFFIFGFAKFLRVDDLFFLVFSFIGDTTLSSLRSITKTFYVKMLSDLFRKLFFRGVSFNEFSRKSP